MSEVRASASTPVTANFAGIGAPTDAPPLVFDRSTGQIYALKTGDVVVGAGIGGTVTSVAQTFTGGLVSVAGSPITGSGTLALTVAGTSGGIPYFSSATAWASSGALTASALVLGGGAGAAPTPMASLGTTTTLLHGNAGGAPTFGAVVLTTDVTGTLPIANGGTAGVTAAAALANLGGLTDPASFTIVETTNATINGADPLLELYADANAALKMYLADVTGGTRIFLWEPARAIPVVPHTGAVPTVAVYGDFVMGDICTFSPVGNAWICGTRTTTGLTPSTDISHYMCAKNTINDTDGGASIDLYPSDNAAGATSDGIVELLAYGQGSGALANHVIFTNRSGTNAVTRRWAVNGSGHFVPIASNTYTLGSTTKGVLGAYLGAGTGADIGQPGRWLAVDASGGAGSPGDTIENTLKTYTVLADTLATNGDSLHWVALFRCAANATTKNIQVYFGATVMIASTAIAQNGQHVVVEGWVMRTGATAQTSYARATETATGAAWSTTMTGGHTFSAPAETLSGAVVLKATITLGAGAALNDVIQDAMYIEYITGA